MKVKFRGAYSRRNVNLLLYQWIELDKVAHQTQSFCTRGTRKGNRSWRCLLRRIAEGELVVISRVFESGSVDPPVSEPKAEPRPWAPPVNRKPGRPIANAEPVEAPADWVLTAVNQNDNGALCVPS